MRIGASLRETAVFFPQPTKFMRHFFRSKGDKGPLSDLMRAVFTLLYTVVHELDARAFGQKNVEKILFVQQ